MKGFSAIAVLVGFCLSAGAAHADNFLIVPGHSIGQTSLGPNGYAELKRLPPADAADNGMQQTHLVWLTRKPGQRDTLFIYGVNNSVYENVKPIDGMTIREIRVTSRQFHTQNGISTASTLAQVRRCFPAARSAALNPAVYNDPQRGIAFEFDQPVLPSSRCIGISVVKPLPRASDAVVTTQSQIDDLLKEARAR